MKTCTHCKIEVGGASKVCPLCQSKLSSVDAGPEEPYFPTTTVLKTVSLLVKIVVFVLIAISTASFFLDTAIIRAEHYHFSRPIMIFIAILLPTLYSFYKNHNSVPRLLLRTMIVVSCLLAYCGVEFGCMELMVWTVVPIVFSATIIANFVFSFIDANFTEDSIFCILINIMIGVATEIYFIIRGIEMPLCWQITKMICSITLIALIIFKGRVLLIEVRKKLNI